MKKIPLTQGKFALVDDENYDYLAQWKWYFSDKGYAVRSVYQDGKIMGRAYMHRIIMGASEGFDIDHINRNTIDNRKRNLRLCSRSQNLQNRIKYPTYNGTAPSSKYKGVSYDKRGRWTAYIRETYIGQFKTEQHAALAYDLWAVDLFGKFAKTNFNHINL